MTDIEKWVEDAGSFLVSSWGLDRSFAPSVALLYLYLSHYGLSPVITSGWRSPAKQEELLRRWKAGDQSIVAKPATNSKHMHTTWLGNPASLAVDISTSNPKLAADIARYLNIKPGYDFNDPVHFYI